MIEFTLEPLVVDRKKVLNECELYISDNSITTITGENGTGKTLLLKRIFKHLKEEGYAVSFVEQSNDYFIKELSIAENIALCDGDDSVYALFDSFGVSHLLTHTSEELSGGEKRILCIMRAFCNLPDGGVVLIDEPTNDLDFDSVEKVLEAFSAFAETHTIIIASHDDRVKNITHSSIHLENGNIVCEEKSSEGISRKIQERRRRYSVRLVDKSLFTNKVLILFSVFIVLLSAFILNETISSLEKCDLELCDNQIDIFTADSAIASEILVAGALPVPALEIMDESKPYGERIRLLKEELGTVDNKPLLLKDISYRQDGYEIIPMELYDLETGDYIRVMDRYKYEYNVEESLSIDTRPYFVDIEIDDDEPLANVEFSPEKLYPVIEDIKRSSDKDKLTVKYAVVIANDVKVEDLISEGALDDILRNNMYFLSNVSCKVYQNLINTDITRTGILFLLLICIMMWAVDSLTVQLMMKKNRIPLVVFLDAGMRFDELYKRVSKKYFCRCVGVSGFLVASVLTAYILYSHEVNLSLLNCSGAAIVGMTYYCCHITRKHIVKKYLSLYSDWRFR